MVTDIRERGENMKGFNRPVLNDEELEAITGGKTGEIKVVINARTAKRTPTLRMTKTPLTGNTQQRQMMRIACPNCSEVLEVDIINVTSVKCTNPSCGIVFDVYG